MTQDAGRAAVPAEAFPARAGEQAAEPGDARAAAPAPGRHVDARVAVVVLVVLNVGAFAPPWPPVEGALVACGAALLLWMRRYRLAAGLGVAYAALVGLTYACVLGGTALSPIGTCFLMFRKVFPTAVFAAAMIAGSHVSEMARALQLFGLPTKVSVPVCVAMRFFPTAAREARSVHEAMVTRGISLTPANVARRPSVVLEGFVVPFLHRLSVVAGSLGDAVTVRGIESRARRTSYYEMRPGLVDALCLAVAVASTALLVARGGAL